MKAIDNFLNRITMYRLVLYYLIVLLAVAFVLCIFGALPFNPIDLFFSTLFLTAISWISNLIFSKMFGAATNEESLYITALILALIIAPKWTSFDPYLWFLIWAAIWSMASKYVLAIRKKHLFNPAAFAVALAVWTINQSAGWWVGTLWMLPFVLVGGLLIVKKIQRFDLVFSFFAMASVTIAGFTFLRDGNIFSVLERMLISSPILFFAFVILTEPLTTPPTKILRMCYGAFVGFLFIPNIHLGFIYSTPELALLVGNVFSYIVSPKAKLILRLREKLAVARNTYDFIYTPDQNFSFQPGQYLEWTLSHSNPDNRGNRRYFTIASSPTENDLRIGVKFYNNSSSFKKNLLVSEKGDTIVASQLAGDFVLPGNNKQKLAFMAGGIGITPFRSMIKYLIDRQERRSIVVFYSNKTIDEIAYKEIFDEAKIFGIKTIYALTDIDSIPKNWTGQRGAIDSQMIAKEIPDYKERIFYVSGPRSMVVVCQEILKNMGVKRNRIKKDFFPGFV